MTHLYLEGNQIDDEACEYLEQGIKRNSTLEYLYINNNRITNAGALKLVAALGENTTIKSIVLFNNLLTEELKQELKKSMAGRMCLFNLLF